MPNIFSRYAQQDGLKRERDYASLWKSFIEMSDFNEQYKVANGVYNVKEAPARSWVEREELKQRKEDENI